MLHKLRSLGRMDNSFFFVFSLFTIFQLLIFVVFLLHKGRNIKANKWLVVFFIAQALAFANSIISVSYYEYFSQNYHYLINIGVPYQLVWGPAYYLYIVFLLKPNTSLKKSQLLHFIPSFLAFVFMLVNYQLASKEHVIELQKQGSIISGIIFSCLTIQLIVYNTLTVIELYRSKRVFRNDSNTYFWAKFFVFSYMSGCAFSIVGSLLNRVIETDTFVRFVTVTSHLYFFIFFNIIFYKALLKPEIFSKSNSLSPKYSQTGLNSSQIEMYYSKLSLFIEKEKPHIKPGLTLDDLASQLKITSRQLSQVINVCEKSNFSDYINQHRINLAKQLLTEANSNELTVLEILYKVGFNSKSSFNTAFKKSTGLTPLQYRKHIKDYKNGSKS